MGNRKLIYGFAFVLAILFSSFYYVAFTTFSQQEKVVKKHHLYMNQIGLYRQEESVKRVMGNLEAAGLRSYRSVNGELTGVVSGVSTNKKETIAQQKKLDQLHMSYLLKTISTNDSKVVNAINSKDYANALELINGESKGIK